MEVVIKKGDIEASSAAILSSRRAYVDMGSEMRLDYRVEMRWKGRMKGGAEGGGGESVGKLLRKSGVYMRLHNSSIVISESRNNFLSKPFPITLWFGIESGFLEWSD